MKVWLVWYCCEQREPEPMSYLKGVFRTRKRAQRFIDNSTGGHGECCQLWIDERELE